MGYQKGWKPGMPDKGQMLILKLNEINKERMIYNKILDEQAHDLWMDKHHYETMLVQAYGTFYGIDSKFTTDLQRDFYTTYIQPLYESYKKVIRAFWCKHARRNIEDVGEYLHCRKCGAVDYGRGWEYPIELHTTILAGIDACVEY